MPKRFPYFFGTSQFLFVRILQISAKIEMCTSDYNSTGLFIRKRRKTWIHKVAIAPMLCVVLQSRLVKFCVVSAMFSVFAFDSVEFTPAFQYGFIKVHHFDPSYPVDSCRNEKMLVFSRMLCVWTVQSQFECLAFPQQAKIASLFSPRTCTSAPLHVTQNERTEWM